MNTPKNTEVLLVEDNPTDVELTFRALKKQGITNDVFHVETGIDALNFIFCREEYAGRTVAKRLRLILLDLKLPKVSGLEVLKQVKSNPETSCIPVVILSSSKERIDIEQAYASGANAYVVKPVNFTDFQYIIQNTCIFWMQVNESPSN